MLEEGQVGGSSSSNNSGLLPSPAADRVQDARSGRGLQKATAAKAHTNTRRSSRDRRTIVHRPAPLPRPLVDTLTLVHAFAVSRCRGLSLLEVRRARPALDTGYYECRASSQGSALPSVARVRVVVTKARGRRPPAQPAPPSQVPSRRATAAAATTTAAAFTTADSPRRPTATGSPFLLPPNEWQARSCPVPGFCLNGGQCTFYESVGEYVCQ